jgi:meiotic recombination protein SPO11
MATPSFRNGYRTPPVYALVDFDPDGLAIYSTYKHGSISLAHENANLNVPLMELLGLQSNNLPAIPPREQRSEEEEMLRLSKRDRVKAEHLIENRINPEFSVDHELVKQLQVMLMLNVKAEIQILEAKEGGLSDWLLSQPCFLI